MKIIIEQSIFTICHQCKCLREHTAQITSSLHFSYGDNWLDELSKFYFWVHAQDTQYINFNEAYIAYTIARN